MAADEVVTAGAVRGAAPRKTLALTTTKSAADEADVSGDTDRKTTPAASTVQRTTTVTGHVTKSYPTTRSSASKATTGFTALRSVGQPSCNEK